MTNFLPFRKTFLQTVIEYSFVQAKQKVIEDIQNQIDEKILIPSNKKMNACYTSYANNTGSQVFKISPHSFMLKENRKIWEGFKNWNTVPTRGQDLRPQYMYQFPSVGLFNIVTLDGTYTMEHSIEIIRDVYEASKDSFYGCLLKSNSTGQYINPLHPLIAQAQVCSDKVMAGTFKIIIYSIDKEKFNVYEEERAIKRVDYTSDVNNHIPAGQLFSKKYDTLFYDSIISNIGTIVEEEDFHTRASSIIPTNDPFVVKYQTKDYDRDGNETTEAVGDDNFYLIPIQLINNGMAFPYYGTVEIRQPINSTYARGMQLSPMQSCNVGMQHIDSNGVSMFGSVCTGSLSNNSNNGRKSLNHANLSSPFFRDVLTVGALRYAQIANQVSLSLYGRIFKIDAIDFDFDGEMEKPIPEKMSFDDYKKVYEGALLNDYLQYVKSIREAELKNEENT